nr:putative integron gene cassette protein [uncultured bacterium]
MNKRAAAWLTAILTVSAGLGGCISADNLRKNTDEKLSSCLHVGMSIEGAEKCTRKADLGFEENRKAKPGVRVYVNTAPGDGLMLIAIVYVRLQFSESGLLESWSSDSATDGL